MRQNVGLDPGTERILPNRGKPLVRLTFLQRQVFAFRMPAFAHKFPRLHTARLPRAAGGGHDIVRGLLIPITGYSARERRWPAPVLRPGSGRWKAGPKVCTYDRQR